MDAGSDSGAFQMSSGCGGVERRHRAAANILGTKCSEWIGRVSP